MLFKGLQLDIKALAKLVSEDDMPLEDEEEADEEGSDEEEA